MVNESFLLTIPAIFAGWLLSEFGQFLRYKREDKRLVNEVLFHLINLRFRLIQTKDIIDAANNQSNLSKNSKRIYNRLIDFDDLNLLKPELLDTVKLISKIDPFLAHEMRITIDGTDIFSSEFLKFKDTRIGLDDVSMMDLNFKSISLFSEKLEDIVRTLAFRKSKVQWVKLHWNLFSERKDDKNVWSNYFENVDNSTNVFK